MSRNRVLVEVISAPPDAETVVERRLGRAVDAKVVATARERPVCVSVEIVSTSPELRTLSAGYETNSVYRFDHVEVRETAEEVRIGVIEIAPNGFVTLVAQYREAEVPLAAPLGNRRIVDAHTGRTLHEPRR